jgi:hypothetical protein
MIKAINVQSSTINQNGSAFTISNPLHQYVSFSGDTRYIFEDGSYVKLDELINRVKKIEERLFILNADPELFEKSQSLKKAYDNYTLLESLLIDSANRK